MIEKLIAEKKAKLQRTQAAGQEYGSELILPGEDGENSKELSYGVENMIMKDD